MENLPRILFCRNLKKIRKKAVKTEKNGSKGSNVATPKEQSRDIIECHANYYNVETSVEIDRSKFSNFVTSP